jgi:hypothetical protein
MTDVTHPEDVGRRRALLAARAVAASILIWLGGMIAAGSCLAVLLELHPLSGARARPFGAIIYMLLCLAASVLPPVAWWFLLPKVRWLGAVLMGVWTLLFFFAVLGLS